MSQSSGGRSSGPTRRNGPFQRSSAMHRLPTPPRSLRLLGDPSPQGGGKVCSPAHPAAPPQRPPRRRFFWADGGRLFESHGEAAEGVGAVRSLVVHRALAQGLALVVVIGAIEFQRFDASCGLLNI